MIPKKLLKNKKGFFLISSYLILSVIGTFSLYIFLKNATTYWASERMRNRIASFHLAEGGVDQAITRLRSDLTYAGQGYTVFGAGGYDIQVDTPSQANPKIRRIIATGYTPNNAANSYAYVRRQVTTFVDFTGTGSGTYAVFSNTSIQMSGNVILDSYDSRLGSYESQAPRSNGDLGTNTAGAGMVMMSGNVRVKGDAIVGPGGNPSQVITTSGHVVIEGSRTAASALRALDPVQLPSGCTNQGSLSLSGNTTLTLTGGTYCYSSVNIAGNGRLIFTGPASFYVTGNFTLGGNGFISSNDLPANLKLFVQGTRTVAINGNGNIYGVVYAPQSGVNISGNGWIYGSATGNTLQQSGNGQVHYDEALNQGGDPNLSGQGRVLAWTET